MSASSNGKAGDQANNQATGQPDSQDRLDDEPPPSGLTLTVVRDVDGAVDGATLPSDPEFQQWAQAALAQAEQDPGRPCAPLAEQALELSLSIVDAEQGRALNAQWRDRNRATNVLSFPGDDMPGLPWRHLGDLVICAEIVAQEAAQQGKQASAHWAHMTIHGLLHLLGYDHEVDDQAEHMEALERRILQDLGFPDPYLPKAKNDPSP